MEHAYILEEFGTRQGDKYVRIIGIYTDKERADKEAVAYYKAQIIAKEKASDIFNNTAYEKSLSASDLHLIKMDFIDAISFEGVHVKSYILNEPLYFVENRIKFLIK
jgi:hypothetical protein